MFKKHKKKLKAAYLKCMHNALTHKHMDHIRIISILAQYPKLTLKPLNFLEEFKIFLYYLETMFINIQNVCTRKLSYL